MSEVASPVLTPAAARLMEAVHGADIYAGFTRVRALNLQGWNGTHPALVRAVEEVRPSLAFDIGVWKGQSVARLAETMRRVRPDSALLAIDTFLGSPGHWDRSRADRIGIMVGDDYPWPGVKKAGDEFAAARGLDLQVEGPKWILRKPA